LSHPVIKPISNPYEIEEYFDRIETSKVAAVLRMIEEEVGEDKLLEALRVNTYIFQVIWFNSFSYDLI
jgi:aminopeptidase N